MIERLMKLVKRLLIIITVASVFLTGFCFSVNALVIFENDFGFELDFSKHEAKLVSYDGNEESVTLPDTFQGYPVTVIDRNVFSGNEKIKEVVFSGTNTTIEEYAFMNCTSLETVYIPENVINFGDRVFAGCSSLKKVTLLSDITTVPTNMFLNCVSLTDLTINEHIASFDYGCFNGCSSLKNLDFVSNGVLIQPYAFNGTGAESLELSDSLFAIPNNSFTNCPSLKYVTIPESVTIIQPQAFDFENITIRCYYDSYAYRYAVENGYSYELLDNVKLGDTDGDDYVNINDVTAIQRHLAELETLKGIYLKAADTNQDGDLDITDATTLQMFLAEYEMNYPIDTVIIK